MNIARDESKEHEDCSERYSPYVGSCKYSDNTPSDNVHIKYLKR